MTDLRFGHCVLATSIGIMPGTLIYAHFGAAAKAALGGEGDSGNAMVVIRRWAHRHDHRYLVGYTQSPSEARPTGLEEEDTGCEI